MADDAVPGTGGWQRAADLQHLRGKGRLTVRLGAKQIALFAVDGRLHACNNRCPHEGYPLVEGTLGPQCVLTCHWHNWKFDLSSGANLHGGDALRVYPVRVEDDAVWVDLSDPAPAQRVAALLDDLDAAMDDSDPARIAREAARLLKAGASADAVLAHAITRGHTRLRYGMTHAYAAAEVWLRLHDDLRDDARQLVCLTEALAHIAFDTLREPEAPFGSQSLAWDEPAFLAAVEAQDEALAAGLLTGAIEAGLTMAELEHCLCQAALMHYSDFGHSLIYLVHVADLARRLGPAALRPLLLCWLRALLYATREDLLPDFRAYAPALSAWPRTHGESARAALDPLQFVGLGVRATLERTLAAAPGHAPQELADALLGAAAEHLLRFDVAHEARTDNPVADNVGWLDFTHGITFARAVGRVCARYPELWPQGLLQLALFVGRNSAYLKPEPAMPLPFDGDAPDLDSACIDRLLDHGLQPFILVAHLLKTWDAGRSIGAPAPIQLRVDAAVARLFQARIKQRHALRSARQALAFVVREG